MSDDRPKIYRLGLSFGQRVDGEPPPPYGDWDAFCSSNGPLFLIVDVRSLVGETMLFWKPSGSGYTVDVSQAGLYTAADAEGMRDTDVAVPFHVVQKRSRLMLHISDLRKDMPVSIRG